MALALVGGAAVGALFGALYDVVKVAVGKTAMQYRPLLGDLKFTLDSLRPRIIQQIGDHNVELGLPNDEIESLHTQMEEGIKLVRKLSNVGMWNCNIWCGCFNCNKPSYAEQLVELDRSLRILLEILRLQEARDVKEALLLARKIHDKQDELDKKMSDLLKVQQEAGLTAQHETTVGELSASNTQTMAQDRVEGNSVQGAALGAAFAVLFGAVIRVKDNTRMFKRVLGYLKSTLDSLKPLIEEVAKCNRVLHIPKEELENFSIEMEKGVELVVKCSKVCRWASYKKYEYSNKLLGLDESLQRLLHILRVQLARDVRESLVSVSNMEKVIKHIAGHDVVQNDEVAGKGLCPLPEPTSTTVGLDVLNVQERGDVIKEASVAARKIVEGVKLIEGSGVLKDQNGIIGLYEVVEPASPKVGLHVLNLQGTMNVEETSDSTTNMEAGVKQTEDSGVVKNQIDIAVTEPQSLRDGLEVANMQGTRDDKQIEGIGAVALQAPVSVYELPSLIDSSFQFGLLDSMSSFEDNQQQQNSLVEALKSRQQSLNFNEYFNLPTEKAGLESENEIEPEAQPGFCPDILMGIAYLQSRQHDDAPEPGYVNRTQSSQHVSQLKSDDGFNWRKYGQKQVKGCEYRRSYYKCTYHNCPTKKKVERSLKGEITEIVYKGSHNHPKPQSTRQSTSRPIQGSSHGLSDQLAPKIFNPKVESAKMPDDLEQNSPISNSEVEDEIEPVAKEWDLGNTNDQATHTFSASGSSIVKEPRTVVHTISDIILVDDGYKWRKYGQKLMKGNLIPRAYYKCTYTGCPVRKHAERSPHDLRSVITTYEGKHNHDVPAARCSGIYSAPKEAASEHQSQSVLDGLDVLDVHATEDAIKKTLVELEQELLNEGSGVVQDQIEIKSSREGIEPPLFVVGLDGLGPMDVKETSDSTSMETLKRQGRQSSCSNKFSKKATLSTAPRTAIVPTQSEIAEIKPKLNLKDVLIYCAHALAEDDLPSATISAEVLGQMVSVSGEPMQRLGAYMLEGLRVRLEKSRSSIYKTLIYEVPTSSQLMSYMSVLYNICPYLKFAYMSANVVIREALENEPRIHIIDFQIAQGSQWVPLIQDLARRPGGPPLIRITGVDDSQSAHARGGGLHIVGERLSKLAASCNVPFDFNAAAWFACEFELENLRIQPGEAIAVNFPYVLNQMPDESVCTQNFRDRLLSLLKSLSPKVMTLVEQECNANTSPFFTRFVELVDYYAAMFESIDVARLRDDKQRICAEMHLVARDMVNMVSCEGLERVKRPEPLGKWRSRMMLAGFTPYPLSSKLTEAIRVLLKEYHGNYRLQEANGALYLSWMHRALVTASAWNISADGSGSSARLFDKCNTVSAWKISADGSGPSTCLSDKFNVVLEPQSEPVLPRDDVPWAYNGVPSSCPLCCEDLDFTDTSFLPCLCGFRLCLFCHKRILEEDGRCPGCRKPYEHEHVEAETSVHGESLTFRLPRSCSMITRS